MLLLGIILFGMLVGAGAQFVVGKQAKGVDWGREVLTTQVLGLLMIAAALGCALGGRILMRRKRWFVLCRGLNRLLRIEAASEIQQTQIMVTVAAVKGQKPN